MQATTWVEKGGDKTNASMEKRFWDRVDKRGLSECWEWKGARFKTGYGAVNLWKDGGVCYAHRVAYVLTAGHEIPKGLCVMHTCDNKPCCNPNHLMLGTTRDNNHDAWDKGRVSKPPLKNGEHAPLAKLTEHEVVEIRKLCEIGLTLTSIGELFNVSRVNVRYIRDRMTWRHVKGH